MSDVRNTDDPTEPDAIFHPDGDGFIPTAFARGPWDPNAQHGGAPSALLARAVEAHESESAMQVARLTIELLRPVPLSRLIVRTHTVRPGRKVQLIEAGLFSGDTEVARATGLRIRVKPLEVPAGSEADDRLTPGPDGGPRMLFERVMDTSFADAMDIVAVLGAPGVAGPGTAWFRLRVPVVAGEDPTPLQRVAAAADFGNGISSVVDWDDGWLFINPDLTVYLHRYPVGPWVALAATTHPGRLGSGLAEAALYDESGRIGRSVQSLLFDHP
jgi:Thioesterase-like superfamily